MITENRMKHIMGVARRCAELAQEKGWSEDRQRQAFLMGWNHDIGYEFCSDFEEHASKGSDVIRRSFGFISFNQFISEANATRLCSFCWWPEIKFHGYPRNHPKRMNEGIPYESDMLDILNIADITTTSEGERCTAQERLNELESRGISKDSEKYQNMYLLCEELNLI